MTTIEKITKIIQDNPDAELLIEHDDLYNTTEGEAISIEVKRLAYYDGCYCDERILRMEIEDDLCDDEGNLYFGGNKEYSNYYRVNED